MLLARYSIFTLEDMCVIVHQQNCSQMYWTIA